MVVIDNSMQSMGNEYIILEDKEYYLKPLLDKVPKSESIKGEKILPENLPLYLLNEAKNNINKHNLEVKKIQSSYRNLSILNAECTIAPVAIAVALVAVGVLFSIFLPAVPILILPALTITAVVGVLLISCCTFLSIGLHELLRKPLAVAKEKFDNLREKQTELIQKKNAFAEEFINLKIKTKDIIDERSPNYSPPVGNDIQKRIDRLEFREFKKFKNFIEGLDRYEVIDA